MADTCGIAGAAAVAQAGARAHRVTPLGSP